ncbi:ThyX-like thymidylate synthase [Rhodococcus phage Rasputin]|nr:ThyX-like thymidylate synthase [Rhodococcus phage Rasputin]
MTTATLIAHTEINRHALREIGYTTHRDDSYEDPGFDGFGALETDADELAEFAGRLCYLSFKRPNPATAANGDYLAHIHEVGHESVEEHATASFYIEASRSVLTELERHRHLSFSVVSQRYVDIGKLGVHIPPAIAEVLKNPETTLEDYRFLRNGIGDHLDEGYDVYNRIVAILEGQGYGRKEAREAARCVVPNCVSSPMIVTGNMRTWKHIIRLRHHEAADAEIRELASELLWQLREIAPNTFADIPDEPLSY